MVWNEGSWDDEGNPTGLPSELSEAGDKFNYIWCIVRLEKSWGHMHIAPVHNVPTILRTHSFYSKENNKPLPRWFWRHAEEEPNRPDLDKMESNYEYEYEIQNIPDSYYDCIKNAPTLEIDSEVTEFLYWLDTSDHWGFDLLGTMHNKIENTFPPKLKVINSDPQKLRIYEELKSMSYSDLENLLINWIGKEEILKSMM